MTKHEAGQRLAVDKLSDILEIYCDDEFICPSVIDDIELALYFLENKRAKTIHIYICDYAEEILNSVVLYTDGNYDKEIKQAKLALADLLKIKSRFKPWK